MTVNQFDRSRPAGTQFNGTGVYAFDRAKMLVGDPAATYIYFNLNSKGATPTHPEGIGSMQPADIDGFQQPAAGQPCPLAYLISNEPGYEDPPFNIDALRMFNFHADFAVPRTQPLRNGLKARLLLRRPTSASPSLKREPAPSVNSRRPPLRAIR